MTTFRRPARGDTGEVALRALFKRAIDGWNASRGERFAAPAIADGDLVAFEVWRRTHPPTSPGGA